MPSLQTKRTKLAAAKSRGEIDQAEMDRRLAQSRVARAGAAGTPVSLGKKGKGKKSSGSGLLVVKAVGARSIAKGNSGAVMGQILAGNQIRDVDGFNYEVASIKVVVEALPILGDRIGEFTFGLTSIKDYDPDGKAPTGAEVTAFAKSVRVEAVKSGSRTATLNLRAGDPRTPHHTNDLVVWAHFAGDSTVTVACWRYTYMVQYRLSQQAAAATTFEQ